MNRKGEAFAARNRDKAMRIRQMLRPYKSPSPQVEQERFGRVVSGYEYLRVQQRESDRQAEMLFQSLLAQAFS